MVAGLLDEGAGDLDSKTFHERLERRAIELRFSAARDHLRGSLRMLKENRDEAFDLLRLALTQPRFDAPDIERIRAQIMSGLRRETSNPGSLASQKFMEAAFGDHPYGRPTNGSLVSVPKIDVDDMRAYTRRILARDTLKIAVVGDIDAATLGTLLDKTFGGLPAKATLTPVPDVVAAKPPQKFVHSARRAADQHRVRRPRHHAQRSGLHGGLCGQPHSRRRRIDGTALQGSAREARPRLFGVGIAAVDAAFALFIGSTGTRADRATDTVAADRRRDQAHRRPKARRSRSSTRRNPISRARRCCALDTSSKLAGALLQYQNDRLGIDYIEKRNGVIDAVTLDDAKARRAAALGTGRAHRRRRPRAAGRRHAAVTATPPARTVN